MSVLNKEQLNEHRPTDVLSFATNEEMQQLTPLQVTVEWGDVVVCPSYASREARRRGVDAREELLRLITHGVLHLRGYDHSREDDEIKMFAVQESIVASM